MRARIAGVVSGTAIIASIAVAALSLVGTANAKSLNAIRSHAQVVAARCDHGRPNLGHVASMLGLSTAELRIQLQSGKSLADIAKAQSVDVAKVIDTIVADITTKLTAKVASGELTQSAADAKLTEITARVTEMVNNARPAVGKGFVNRGGRGDHGSHGYGQESNA